MSKFTKITTSINAAHNLSEVERQINAVKKSKLTEEEKSKALKAHNKMIKTTVLTVIIVTIIMAILMIIGFSISGEVGAVISVIALIIMPTILITYVIIVRKRKMFPDWVNAYNKVDSGLDGLDEQEINKLKPNTKEELLIKKYKKKSLVSGLIFLITIGVMFVIVLSLEIEIYSPIVIILAFIITGVWYVFEDTYQVQIHRIKSGYYKKSIGFICQTCKKEVNINFTELENYDSLPRNKQGIRVMNCHNCGNLVPIYNFDNSLEDYKKYLEEIK